MLGIRRDIFFIKKETRGYWRKEIFCLYLKIEGVKETIPEIILDHDLSKNYMIIGEIQILTRYDIKNYHFRGSKHCGHIEKNKYFLEMHFEVHVDDRMWWLTSGGEGVVRNIDVSSQVFISDCLNWLMVWGGSLFLFT